MFKRSPVKWYAVLLEFELNAALTAQEQVGESNAELLLDFGSEGVPSLGLELDEEVGFLSQFRFNSLDGGVGVCTDVVDFSGSSIIDTDLCLELSLEMA